MLRWIVFASHLALLAPDARAERPIAIAKVAGLKRAQPRAVESGIAHALHRAEMATVNAEDLAQLEGAGTELMAARDLDADYLLTVSIAPLKRTFRAEAKLVATER